MSARIFVSTRLRASATAASTLLALAATGCGMTGSSSSSSHTPINTPSAAGSITGTVHGGEQALGGSVIQLYAVGQSGYASAATPLLTSPVTTLTDGSGSFSITGKYSCPAGSYVYLTASGGTSSGQSGSNSAIALASALGSCSQLLANANTTFVVINEVTTVAAAYALAQFSAGTTFGTSLKTQPGSTGSTTTAPADNFGTSATNVQGLANAMAIAQVIANPATGMSPGSNLNKTATPEYWTVNTIADILASCVNTADSTTGSTASNSSACTTLFTDTTPTGGTKPADTFQAALQMALHPGDPALTGNIAALNAQISGYTPFQPYVNTTATANSMPDYTIGISYAPVTPSSTTALLNATNFVAIDGFGNAWLTNLTSGVNSPVVELAPNGDPVKAGSGTSYAVTQYVYNTGTASNPSTSTLTNGGPVSAGGEFSGIALDTNNNAWVGDTTNGYLFRISASGASFGLNGEVTTNANGGVPATGNALSTNTNSGTATLNGHPTGIALDGNNNLFAIAYGNGATSPGGADSSAACGSTTDPYTFGNKNLFTFAVAGLTSPTQGSPLIIGSPAGSNQSFLALDNSALDKVSGTAIPGAPFVWNFAEASGGTESHGASGHYGYLYQSTTQTGGNTPQGCLTSAGSISSANSGATTKITVQNSTDPFNNPWGVAFDSSNNLWTGNQDSVSGTAATQVGSFTRLTPAYGGSSTAPTYTGFTYANYATGGASAIKPLAIVVDGAGNVYGPNANAGSPVVAAMTNSGAALAPAAGFTGSTYSPDGTTLFKRTGGNADGAAIDLSGNLWFTNGTAGSTNVNVLVGLAAPVVTPTSVAVKNSTLGQRP